MSASTGTLVLRALDARIVWTAPAEVVRWLADGPMADLVERDDGPATVHATFAWTAMGNDGWRCMNDDSYIQAATVAECLAEAMIVMNRLAARSVTDRMLALHAGVVVEPTTKLAIAFCGHSGAGKSTATAAAVQAGFGYLADEVCAVDLSTMTVRQYARPIGLRQGGADALGIAVEPGTPWRPPSIHSGEATLGAVALVERGEGPASLAALSRADALHRIANHSLGDIGTERVSFRRLESLVRDVPALVIAYADAPHAAATLRDWVIGRARIGSPLLDSFPLRGKESDV